MATQTIDYDALAKQYGAVSSQPQKGVDYDALAKQYGATSSTAQPTMMTGPQPIASHDSAPGRFAIGFNEGFGIPESVSRNPAEGVEGIKLAVSHPKLELESLKSMYQGMTEAQQNVIDRAYRLQHSSSIADKANGFAMGIYSAIPVLGPAIVDAVDTINGGDTARGIGKLTALAAQTAIPAKAGDIAEGAVNGARAATSAIKGVATGIEDASAGKVTSAARATIPEAADLPNKAVAGVEKIYRAAAPVGSDPMFRGNLYKAAGDLAEIGKAAKADLEKAKGGIAQPDMRVRAVVSAINDHLSDMYKQERVPQIARNAENPVALDFGKDANEGLKFLSRNAGTDADRTLASKASSSEHMTLAEVDQLAKVVNKELLGYESMTPAERAAVSQTSRRLAGLKALDKGLGDMIGTELDNRGEAGIKDYEGRYAALSSIRNQLQSRMNAVELKQPGVLKAAVQPVTRLLTGGKSGIASASQAAVADVNIGRQLQQGLQKLADSGLKANRGNARGIRPVRGLLTTGPKRLPASTLGDLIGVEK